MKSKIIYYIVVLIGIFAYVGLKEFFLMQGLESYEAIFSSIGIILGICAIIVLINIYVINRRKPNK